MSFQAWMREALMHLRMQSTHAAAFYVLDTLRLEFRLQAQPLKSQAQGGFAPLHRFPVLNSLDVR